MGTSYFLALVWKSDAPILDPSLENKPGDSTIPGEIWRAFTIIGTEASSLQLFWQFPLTSFLSCFLQTNEGKGAQLSWVLANKNKGSINCGGVCLWKKRHRWGTAGDWADRWRALVHKRQVTFLAVSMAEWLPRCPESKSLESINNLEFLAVCFLRQTPCGVVNNKRTVGVGRVTTGLWSGFGLAFLIDRPRIPNGRARPTLPQTPTSTNPFCSAWHLNPTSALALRIGKSL